MATNIPLVAMHAYRAAAAWSVKHDASCHMAWPYLAAFGRIESDHGRTHGSVLAADGTATPAIYGAAIAAIKDAHGKPVRAGGPMQFIPSTWATWGTGSVQNINNAALAAAKYLCANGRNMATAKGRHDGAFSYNHVEWYAVDIEALFQAYLHHTSLSAYPVAPPQPKPSKSPKPKPSKPAPPKSAAPTPGKPKPSPSHRPTSAPTKKPPTRTPSPTPTHPSPSRSQHPDPPVKPSPSSSPPSS